MNIHNGFSVKGGLSKRNTEFTEGSLCKRFTAGIGGFSYELQECLGKDSWPASLSAFVLRSVATAQYSRSHSIFHGAQLRWERLSFSFSHSPTKEVSFALEEFTLPSLYIYASSYGQNLFSHMF